MFYSLVHFPSIHKSIEFSDDPVAQETALQTRTFEGLDLKVHFSFQYQLQKDNLPVMYQMLFENYEKIFTRVARNCILEEAAKFNANDYWKKRTEIGN